MKRLTLVLLLLWVATARADTSAFSDAFTYANGFLSTANAQWVEQTGLNLFMAVTSNTINPADSGTGVARYDNDGASNYQGVVWPDDQYASIKVTITGTAGGGSGGGPCVRMSAVAETFYCIAADHAASNNVQITKALAGTYSTVGAQCSQAFTDGNTWKLTATGGATTTLKLYLNGAEVCTGHSDSSSAITSGNAGFRYSSTETSASFDDFDGGSVGAAAGSLFRVQGDLTGLGTGGKFFKDPSQ